MSSAKRESARVAALDAADAVVGGRLGIIEGCRRLSSLSHDLVSDWRVDEDFAVFGAVDSETDDLPIGRVREHWSASALQLEDEKIENAESLHREKVVSACRNLIKRFKDVQF